MNVKTLLASALVILLVIVTALVTFHKKIADFFIRNGWTTVGQAVNDFFSNTPNTKARGTSIRPWHFPRCNDVVTAAQAVKGISAQTAVYDSGQFASVDSDAHSFIGGNGSYIILNEEAEISWKLAKVSALNSPNVRIRVDGGKIFTGSVIDGLAKVIIPQCMQISFIEENPKKTGPILISM